MPLGRRHSQRHFRTGRATRLGGEEAVIEGRLYLYRFGRRLHWCVAARDWQARAELRARSESGAQARLGRQRSHHLPAQVQQLSGAAQWVFPRCPGDTPDLVPQHDVEPGHHYLGDYGHLHPAAGARGRSAAHGDGHDARLCGDDAGGVDPVCRVLRRQHRPRPSQDRPSRIRYCSSAYRRYGAALRGACGLAGRRPAFRGRPAGGVCPVRQRVGLRFRACGRFRLRLCRPPGVGIAPANRRRLYHLLSQAARGSGRDRSALAALGPCGLDVDSHRRLPVWAGVGDLVALLKLDAGGRHGQPDGDRVGAPSSSSR